MASPAAALPPVPPPPEPQAIRVCLTPDVAAEFDAEWNIVLDKAKQSTDLAPVHALLAKWRHFAYAELKDPRLLEGLDGTAVNLESSVGFRVVLDGVPWTVLAPQRKRQRT